MNLIQALLIIITIGLNVISPQGEAVKKARVLGESTSQMNHEPTREIRTKMISPTPKEFHRIPNPSATEIKKEQVQKIASPSPTLSITQKAYIQKKEEEMNKLRIENAKSIKIKQELLKKELNASAGSGLKESEKQRIEEKHKQYETKIKQIHDEKKKQAVMSIDSKISQTSRKMTDKMNEVIGKLNTLLTSLNTQITSLKSQGVNVSDAERASIEAQTAIINAQTAVINQIKKTYTLQIPNEESKLKESVGGVVSILNKDLGATYKAVSDAKEAVTKTYKEISRLKSELKTTSSINK